MNLSIRSIGSAVKCNEHVLLRCNYHDVVLVAAPKPTNPKQYDVQKSDDDFDCLLFRHYRVLHATSTHITCP